jgi:hypothetical protein
MKELSLRYKEWVHRRSTSILSFRFHETQLPVFIPIYGIGRIFLQQGSPNLCGDGSGNRGWEGITNLSVRGGLPANKSPIVREAL